MCSRIYKIIVAVALVAATVVVWAFDPSECAWMPKCVFHSLTGWQCPGCGVTRAAHSLLHGHPLDALRYNYFFIISIPYLLSAIVAIYCRAAVPEKIRRAILGPTTARAYAVLFAGWWITRNLLGI